MTPKRPPLSVQVPKYFTSRCIVTVTGQYNTRHPMHCGHLWSTVHPHLSSNHSSFIQQSSLAITNRHLVAKQEKFGEKWLCILPTKYLFSHLQGTLPCYKSLPHGTDDFTFPPKELVLRISIALKNHCPWSGMKLWTLGPMASMLPLDHWRWRTLRHK
jgi:hypothetical protein